MRRAKPEIGILAPAWLNLFKLDPGQVIFLPPGVLHAYLRGVGLEIMANSDNVVRGGLTDKHVDVPELMRILDFDEMELRISEPRRVGPCEKRFQAPVEEFALSEIRIRDGERFESRGPRSVEILLCLEGRARLAGTGPGAARMEIAAGESCLVPASAPGYGLTGPTLLYKASVAGEGWARETDS
jgi:mannose-6-phosphate isomerase